MSSANDYLMSGGVKSASFKEKGAKVSGVIIREPELQQQRDIKDGKPLTYDDGSPRMQIKVILKTDEKDDTDDNGERAVYLKGGSLKAAQKAVKDAGASGLSVGGKLALKYVKDGEQKTKGFNPPKIYAAKYEAPDPMAQAAANEPEAAEDTESLEDF